MSLGRRIATGAIVAYQRTLSPLLGANCRFLPSCSEYARMAIDDWGVLRGSWLALRRLSKCHPFHPGGLDLPPRPPGVAAHAPPTDAPAASGNDGAAPPSHPVREGPGHPVGP